VDSLIDADFILNTGPWEDGETIADYESKLVAGVEHGLKMICANPDLEVIRGGRRIICAGALAQRFEELGGNVLYYGKPYPPIYDSCLHLIGNPEPRRVLAIGDSLRTDIAGAAGMGMDSILVLGGIHGEAFASHDLRQRREVETRIAEACAEEGNFPIAAIAEFSW
jgi:HAD superfamily hydrolase (TIGR01459 family)